MSERSAKNRYNDSKTGQFVKGNPGKPVGTRHMTTKIIEAITKVSEDGGTSDDVAIVKKLVEKAKAGDMRGIELILGYVDGKPTQPIGGTGEDGAIEIRIKHV